MAFLDFAQRFIDAVGRDDAASAKSPFVLFRILGHFAIAQAVVFRRFRRITSGGRNHAALDAALVEIADKFRHGARNQVPLKNLAIIAGDVQMSVKNVVAGLGLDPPVEGFADDKVRPRNNYYAKAPATGGTRHAYFSHT